MKRQTVFFTFLGLIMGIFSQAQELPTLPADPAVKTGILKNGTRYQIVQNPSTKGFANFALAQKVGTAMESDAEKGKAVALAREALANTPHFGKRSPQEFLRSYGVTPYKDGFVKVSDIATVFNFRNMRIASEEVVDSVLFLLCDIMERRNVADDEFLRSNYYPANNCIIISGDVKADEVVKKLNIMTMMTPADTLKEVKPKYEFKAAGAAKYEALDNGNSAVSTVRVSYLSPRFPAEYLNTIQPAIYNMYVAELGSILTDRFLRHGYAASFRHVSSADTDKDELFELTLRVRSGKEKEAVGYLASSLRETADKKIRMDEFLIARNRYLDGVLLQAKAPFKANDSYVEKCLASYLFGAPMISPSARYDFYVSRELPDERELEFFSVITSALVEATQNMTVSATGKLSADELKQCFEAGWNKNAEGQDSRTAETVIFPELQNNVKVKIKADRPEPMSDGRVWVFSNGVRVIYKQMETFGKTYFSLALNSGMCNVSDLKYGEGAFLADYLGTRSVAGFSAGDVESLFAKNAINVQSDVSQSSMEVYGDAPTEKLPLLLRSLLAITNEGAADSEAFKRYMENEMALLSVKEENVNEIIDSLLCPDYQYSRFKKAGVLNAEFEGRAEAFYKSAFSKINDGVLVIVTDEKPETVKKLLLPVVGHFKTADRAFARPVARYTTPSGWMTYTVDGEVNSIDFVMSAPLTLTADNVVAAMVAANILYQDLSEALVDTGMYINLDYDCSIYPSERMSVMIKMNESNPDGFASYTVQSGSLAALGILRESLSHLMSSKVSDSKLASVKSFVKNWFGIMLSDPSYICKSIVTRYVDGKDFVSECQKKADAVTVDRVMDILKALDEGTKVEYIVNKK